MSPYLLLIILLGYFVILFFISHLTSKNTSNSTFFVGNRKSPWYVVAFAMIGTSISGVTFISVPGDVGKINFHYFQMVLGYLLGYFVIYSFLMTVYYKLNLISIYSYLNKRFGIYSYKTGSLFFIISRTIGSSLRLFLVAGVLQIGIFNRLGVPFVITVLVSLFFIFIYTFRSGIKTILYTDLLQTFFFLLAVVVTILYIASELNFSLSDIFITIYNDPRSKVFEWDWNSKLNFFKQFFSGTFIAIVMTGLDQDQMQKNLTCRTLRDAQKNMFWFSIILIPVNLLFLSLGVLLYQYAHANAIALPTNTDDLFPLLAFNHFTTIIALIFFIGIIAAAFSSADSALTSLTTAFCVDFLNFSEQQHNDKKYIRTLVHIGFCIVTFLIILLCKWLNDESIITTVFKIAGYTYGPLLGLFSFGLLTKLSIIEKYVPVIAVLSPILCFIISRYSEQWFSGYKFGFELLILNGIITFVGLLMISKRNK